MLNEKYFNELSEQIIKRSFIHSCAGLVLLNEKYFAELGQQIIRHSFIHSCAGLVLLNEKYFNELRQQIIGGQPTDKQNAMAQCFENLMDGIERNLLTKNRDRFTQNLSVFRFVVRRPSYVCSPVYALLHNILSFVCSPVNGLLCMLSVVGFVRRFILRPTRRNVYRELIVYSIDLISFIIIYTEGA